MEYLANLMDYRIDRSGGTQMRLSFRENLLELLVGKGIHRVGVLIEDGRHITPEQRKKAYATIRDIAVWTGEMPEVEKELMKYYHIGRTGSSYFSLGSCSVDTARSFIATLLDFALENGIQLGDYGANRADDVEAYLAACIRHRRCAVCGRRGELHHVDTIGMGFDRTTVDDSRKKKMCLCREHHTEAHQIGQQKFNEKYHIFGILYPE